MLGNNPKRPAEFGDGNILKVQRIFKTLQGEGPNVGLSAIFIRLGGCNLACSFCDTEFEDYKEIALDQILQTIKQLSLNQTNQRSVGLVVITGGEPFRQTISLLCTKILELGFAVQIETNGTLYRPLPKQVEIICSPKVVSGKYLSINSELLPNITALKFLVSKNQIGYSTIPELGRAKYNIPVFIQPMDEQDAVINQQNKNLAVHIALNQGYRLSYQIHKELNIE